MTGGSIADADVFSAGNLLEAIDAAASALGFFPSAIDADLAEEGRCHLDIAAAIAAAGDGVFSDASPAANHHGAAGGGFTAAPILVTTPYGQLSTSHAAMMALYAHVIYEPPLGSLAYLSAANLSRYYWRHFRGAVTAAPSSRGSRGAPVGRGALGGRSAGVGSSPAGRGSPPPQNHMIVDDDMLSRRTSAVTHRPLPLAVLPETCLRCYVDHWQLDHFRWWPTSAVNAGMN